MSKIAIIYGSSSGNTQNVAETMAEKLSGEDVTLLDVAKVNIKDIEEYPNLILGTSTWGLGDLQDDWETFLPKLASTNLQNKTIALFGLGDSGSYPDTFVDGMGIIYNTIKDKNIDLIGKVSVDDYEFDDSKAVNNGVFVGLALDEDNESDKTDERISGWLAEIIPSLQ